MGSRWDVSVWKYLSWKSGYGYVQVCSGDSLVRALIAFVKCVRRHENCVKLQYHNV